MLKNGVIILLHPVLPYVLAGAQQDKDDTDNSDATGGNTPEAPMTLPKLTPRMSAPAANAATSGRTQGVAVVAKTANVPPAASVKTTPAEAKSSTQTEGKLNKNVRFSVFCRHRTFQFMVCIFGLDFVYISSDSLRRLRRPP